MQKDMKLRRKLQRLLQVPLWMTFLLVILDVVMYFEDPTACIAISIFIVIYLAVMAVMYKMCQPLLKKSARDYSIQYGEIQRRLLDEFEVPYALLDMNGKILWMNDRFCSFAQKEKNYHKAITAVFPSLSKEMLNKIDGEEQVHLERNDKKYHAHLKKIHPADMMTDVDLLESGMVQQDMIVLYLFDETDLHYYRDRLQEEKMVAVLLYIDNYEEVLSSVEEVKRALLTALVDRRITQYFDADDSLVKKFDRDKYFIVFKQSLLQHYEEDKFHILEETKEVNIGNSMSVTISIGVGADGKSYSQNYEYAAAAMDLALGRGGDQVIVKRKDKLTYYGGKTKQIEKGTRVKARVKAQALHELFQAKETIYIMGHHIPDVDSFGAAIGVFCAAHSLGKKAHIVLNDMTTSIRMMRDNFTSEKGYPEDMFLNGTEALNAVTGESVIMVVDVNRPSYTECPELLTKSKNIVVFDHHRQSAETIENAVLSYIEPYASSTCEMIAEVLQYFAENIKLKPAEADSIYAGIIIDTNNFMTKTGVRTFEAAAYLKRAGADVMRVRKILQNDMEAYKARAEAVRNAEVCHGCFAVSVCPSGTANPTVTCAQSANELLNIIGIKASFVMTEYQDKIYISSRSIDEINVQLIMEKLGGGGHSNVAGAQLKDCSIEQAKEIVKQTIDEMIKKGDL